MHPPDTATIRLTIELDPDANPVSGTVDTSVTGSSPQEFNGWTEFSMAIETCMAQVRAARSADTSAAHDNRREE